jgi:hypothetical protein
MWHVLNYEHDGALYALETGHVDGSRVMTRGILLEETWTVLGQYATGGNGNPQKMQMYLTDLFVAEGQLGVFRVADGAATLDFDFQSEGYGGCFDLAVLGDKLYALVSGVGGAMDLWMLDETTPPPPPVVLSQWHSIFVTGE